MTEIQIGIVFLLGSIFFIWLAWSIYKSPNKCDKCPFDCALCPWEDKYFAEAIFQLYIEQIREKEKNSTNDI